MRNGNAVRLPLRHRVLGLRSTLRDAGVRTVISSVWKVDDQAMAELMTRYYRNLWLEGLCRLEALHRAQPRNVSGELHCDGRADYTFLDP